MPKVWWWRSSPASHSVDQLELQLYPWTAQGFAPHSCAWSRDTLKMHFGPSWRRYDPESLDFSCRNLWTLQSWWGWEWCQGKSPGWKQHAANSGGDSQKQDPSGSVSHPCQSGHPNYQTPVTERLKVDFSALLMCWCGTQLQSQMGCKYLCKEINWLAGTPSTARQTGWLQGIWLNCERCTEATSGLMSLLNELLGFCNSPTHGPQLLRALHQLYPLPKQSCWGWTGAEAVCVAG